jgi:hypothetical protein
VPIVECNEQIGEPESFVQEALPVKLRRELKGFEAMSKVCQTSVETLDAKGNHVGFRACGEPAIAKVMVGQQQCNYCLKHAAAARQFVETTGQDWIADQQRKTNFAG